MNNNLHRHYYIHVPISQTEYDALQQHLARHVALIECCNVNAVTIADVIAAKVFDAHPQIQQGHRAK